MPDLFRSAFHRGPLRVDHHGTVFTAPWMPAGRWLDLLSSPQWHADVFRLCEEDQYEGFLSAVLDGDADVDDLVAVARALLSEAAGRPWWEAERLASLLGVSVLLGGVMADGPDPENVSLAVFLSVVHTALMKTAADEMKRMQLTAELSVPPPGAESDEPEDDMATIVGRMRGMPGVSTR